MSDERWIVVRNWDKFQHYSDRDPTWIKVYTELEHRDDWLHLSLSERGLLVCIWLEYALRHGHLRTVDLPSFILQKVPRRSLDSLQQAGFIELCASKPLALARADARSRRERERTPYIPLLKKTGFRLVRGSHGVTYVPDPNGTDRPPG